MAFYTQIGIQRYTLTGIQEEIMANGCLPDRQKKFMEVMQGIMHRVIIKAVEIGTAEMMIMNRVSMEMEMEEGREKVTDGTNNIFLFKLYIIPS